MEPKLNLGTEVEDIVEALCSRAFFADFVFRSPQYRKQNGQTKEAVDLLVVFGTSLIAIQVKSKQLDGTQGTLAAHQFTLISIRSHFGFTGGVG